jgi:4-amino-4-deoxy-L-arabinose transferase-like glycosyltransferase
VWAAALQLVIFGLVAIYRTVDVDEGGYALASRLVREGKLLYSDFVYYQMPLLPYAYGAWTAVVGETWYTARFLSVLLATATGTLLLAHVSRRFGPALGAVALTLYVSTTLVVSWFVTVKTYALSTFMLLASYVVLERAPRPRNRVAAGVLLGLAMDTRLTFAAAVPALALGAARQSPAGGRLRAVAQLGGGLIVGLVPALLYLAHDPGRLLFDTLGAQANRTSAGLIGNFGQKVMIVHDILGTGQLAVLATATVAALVVTFVAWRRFTVAAAIVVLLGAAHLLPTPTYEQYYTTVVPFAILVIVETVARAAGLVGAASAELTRVVRVAGLAAVGVYASSGALGWYYEVRGTPEDVRVSRVEHVRKLVDARTRPGEEVIASWPGYLFGSHADSVSGLEDGFAAHTAEPLTEAERQKYHVAGAKETEQMILDHRTRLLVVRQWHAVEPLPGWDGAARRAGYRLVTRIGDARIYELPSAG